MSTLQKHVLSNGVRVLIEPLTHVHSAAVGLWCQTGSRHETESEGGITHFIEHMLFKGTPTRTAKEIAESIEGRGGMLNAFTDKEQTCYYCRVLKEDIGTGIDVLGDMMTHSLLDPEELAKEKGVILEEIKRSEDEPEGHVHDLHIEGRWGQHELGKPIIGTAESVSSFEREHMAAYMARRYRGDNIILSVAGNTDPTEVLAKAEALLGDIPSGANNHAATQPASKPVRNEVKKDVEQVHFCIGGDSVSLYADEIYTMAVLDAILGSGMSSRLFQEIREKRGLAYSVGSYNLSYSAGGLFTVYGGTGMKTWPQVQELVRVELDKMMKDGPTEAEMARARQSIRGNVVLALEGMSARMMRMSKNELNHNRDIPIEETLGKIDAVTAANVTEVAQRFLGEQQMSVTAIGPF